MAKYYVKINVVLPAADAKVYTPVDHIFQEIVAAKDEMDACVKVWLRMRIDVSKASWKVGELGFDNHDDDIYFGASEVLTAIKKYEKNRKDRT